MALWTPDDLASCEAELDATDSGSLTLDGDEVDQWATQSGGLRDFDVDVGGTDEPTYDSDGWDGTLPSISAGDTSTCLVADAAMTYRLTDDDCWWVFAVELPSSPSASGAVACNGTSIYNWRTWGLFYNHTSGDLEFRATNGSGSRTTAAVMAYSAGKYIFRVHFGGSYAEVYVDGESTPSAQISGAFNGAGSSSASRLFEADDVANSLTGVKCICYAMGKVQDDSLSALEADKLEGWAAHLADIASNLPTAHQYRYYPPGEAELAADTGSFTVTGQGATLTHEEASGYELEADTGAFTVTGNDAALTATRSVACDTGSVACTGNDADLTVGRSVDCDAGAFSLSGNDAALTATREIAADAGSFTLTGNDAALAATREIAAEVGQFELTGNAAELATARAIEADAGAFTQTGNDASLTATREIAADAGAYTLTGNDADLQYAGGASQIDADTGSFTVTGNDADLTVARSITCDTGSFALTGNDAGLAHGHTTAADAAAFTLTGNDASVVAARVMECEAGSFTCTGNDAALRRGYEVDAERGAFTCTGNDSTLTADRVVDADAGAYTYTGNDASLVYNVGSYTITADAGSFGIVGYEADLIYVRAFWQRQMERCNALMFASTHMSDVVTWRSIDGSGSQNLRALWSESERGADASPAYGAGIRSGDGEARCLLRKSDMPDVPAGFIVRAGRTWQIIEAAEPDALTWEMRLSKPTHRRVPGRFQEV